MLNLQMVARSGAEDGYRARSNRSSRKPGTDRVAMRLQLRGDSHVTRSDGSVPVTIVRRGLDCRLSRMARPS
jgi:hypothetical protein